MERLTSSPHVINVFGFCGHSVVTEFADGPRVGELADKAKRKPLARLKIASDIAHGLADVHGIDGEGNTTFVHFDVNMANVVSINGTLKLNGKYFMLSGIWKSLAWCISHLISILRLQYRNYPSLEYNLEYTMWLPGEVSQPSVAISRGS